MKTFTSQLLRSLWLKFYQSKGHKIIKSASVLPENDPTSLFTTAGMQPLVPYLLGEKHPMGTRLTDIQKCIRTGDIDEVGDNYHLTFFEMMGNWSLGDYFKDEKVAWSFEFLTSPDYLGLKLDQIAVTCFEGNENAPRDEQTYALWHKMGVPKDRIYFLPKSENWWELNRGPCGPDSEMFLDTGKPKCSPNCSPACSCGKFMEIGNDVYMQYNRVGDNEYIPAVQKNVDTGFGIERSLLVLNGLNSVYQTDFFTDALAKIEELSNKKYNDNGDEWTASFRIIADHVRAITMILGDEKAIKPSNVGAGYVLRRLIRRSIRHAKKLGMPAFSLGEVAKVYCNFFADIYEELKQNEASILEELRLEEERFEKMLTLGTKEFEKVVNGVLRHIEFASKQGGEIPQKVINGKSAFRLYDTFGFPIEFTREMATECGFTVDEEGFKQAYKEHQELARTTSAGSFKGGLADNSEQTARLHTATHLMQAGLQKCVDSSIRQKGSNITPERLRFDFNCDHKLTEEEIKNVENYVNEAIKAGVDVVCEEMTVDEAKAQGALGVFDSKYGEKVKVYTMGKYSKEICGGPHAKNTSELHHFKIIKEESSSAGIRRIKAIID